LGAFEPQTAVVPGIFCGWRLSCQTASPTLRRTLRRSVELRRGWLGCLARC
jgi:hypothetical protein